MLLEAGDVIYYIVLMLILEPCIELNYENVNRSMPVENVYTILQKLNKIGSHYSYRNLLRERFISQMEKLLQDLVNHIIVVTGFSIKQLAHLNPLTHGLFEVRYLTACGLNRPQICG